MFRRYSLYDGTAPPANVSVVPNRQIYRRSVSSHNENTSSSVPSGGALSPPKPLLLETNFGGSAQSVYYTVAGAPPSSWYARIGSSLRKSLLRRTTSVSGITNYHVNQNN